MKRCSKCKEEKRDSEFYTDKRHADGLKSECKTCNKKGRPSDTGLWSHRYAKYGVTQYDVTLMLKSQNGICPICQQPVGENDAVDHCHKTGKFRGVLHVKCNSLLGFAEDDVTRLHNAINYLSNPPLG